VTAGTCGCVGTWGCVTVSQCRSTLAVEARRNEVHFKVILSKKIR